MEEAQQCSDSVVVSVTVRVMEEAQQCSDSVVVSVTVRVMEEAQQCSDSVVVSVTVRVMEEAQQCSDSVVESGHSNEVFSDMAIGTDGMFICTFLISFLFNWLGFLLSLCLSNTVAGRCGALSGLGLSIIKWVAIVKHRQWASDFADGDSWLWWLLFFCGFLLFIRGSVQYVRVKYEWAQLSNRLRRYRLI
ncbi:NEDD4 family-interacting protein 1-like isoform X2 [Littorina saxatilis]|uniref:NEDD4 family-interacting protein 1-like isoform X2 n=1 Tax=Littorina saxatilis TaxID=31220 RepID=UPI0038B6B1A8